MCSQSRHKTKRGYARKADLLPELLDASNKVQVNLLKIQKKSLKRASCVCRPRLNKSEGGEVVRRERLNCELMF